MVRKANHCVFDIRYPLVVEMKYRKKILVKDECIYFLCQLIERVGEHYESEIEERGGGDPVQVLLSVFPRESLSKIMNVIKSITAKRMFKRFPEIKRQLLGGEFWSAGWISGNNWSSYRSRAHEEIC